MLLFLGVSLFAFLAFELAYFAQPIRFAQPNRAYGWPSIATVILSSSAAGVASALLLILCIMVLLFVLLFILDQSGLASIQFTRIVSRPGANVLIGLVFGVLLAIWINGIVVTPARDGLGTRQVLQGFALIILFVAGLVGVPAERFIRQLANNVTKVSVPGLAEVSFAETARVGARVNTEASVVAPPSSNFLPPGTSQGLSSLADLATHINRDCAYINLGLGKAMEPCHTSRIELTCKVTPKAEGCLQSELAAAEIFAKALIVDYANCLSKALDRGTDEAFVNERLAGLASRLRELVASHSQPSEFAQRAALTLFGEMVALVSYISPAFFVPNPPESDDELNKACAPVLGQLCNFEPKRGQSQIANLAPATSQGSSFSIENCGRRAAAQVAGLLPSPEFAEWRDAIRPQIEASLAGFLGLGTYRERPYLVVAHAHLMSHLRNYEAALFRLYEWVSDHEKTQPGLLKGLAEISSAEIVPQAVFAVRARITIMAYEEEWLRRLGATAPISLRDQHLKNLDRLIWLQERIKVFRDIFTNMQLDKYDLEAVEFRALKNYQSPCSFSDSYRTRLLYGYVSHKLLYAYNALKNPDFLKDNSPIVRARVLDVANANLSCILESEFGRWGGNILRADALDLYAQLMLREAISLRERKEREDTLATLQTALAATKLARSLIWEAKENDEDKRNDSSNFIERISVTPAYDTFESLERTVKAIENTVQDVEKND